MADALASGASVRKDVGVQVPPRPPVVGVLIRVLVRIFERRGQDPAPDPQSWSDVDGNGAEFTRVVSRSDSTADDDGDSVSDCGSIMWSLIDRYLPS